MKPQIFIILVLSLVKQSFGQVTNIEAWQGFFSYTDIKALASGGDKIYAASENAVFSYNLLTTETETLTTIDGLSGEFITTFHFSNDYDVLIIGYRTGLIEVFNLSTNEVLKVVDILNKNSFYINNLDINLICEQPKVSKHRIKIINSLSNLLNIDKNLINLKGKTVEKLGLIGKEKAIACEVICSISQ